MTVRISFKNWKSAGLAMAIALGLPGLAAAQKDFCITVNASTYVLIGKGFIAPGQGKCKPWTGLVTQDGENSPSAGTACESSDGSHLNVTITTTYPEAGFYFFDSVVLALPSNTGTDIFASLGSSGGTSYSAVGATCGTQPVPAVKTDSVERSAEEFGPGSPN